MATNIVQRFLAPPPRNVGGGDLVIRVVATGLLILLVAMVAPQAHVPYALMKVSLLIAAELGLLSIMLGLFLRTQTFFAGAQLFATPLVMLFFATRQPWVGIAIGLAVTVVGIAAILTRRSRINAALEINSMKVPLEVIEEAAAIAPQGATK